MKDDFEKYLEKQMQNPNFKREYDLLAPERNIIQALINAREELGLTQKELSEKEINYPEIFMNF